MLKFLRHKKTAKKIWIGLAILVLPAFVFWGFGSAIDRQKKSGYVGKISSRKISLLEYKDSVIAARNAAIIQLGSKFYEVQKDLNLETMAWERLILLQEAKNRRITASDREVIELIESYPFFQRNGNFDNRIYDEVIKYVFRIQPRVFEEETRQNIILSKLYQQIIGDVKVDGKEVREGYIKANNKGKANFRVNEKKFALEQKEFGLKILEEKRQEKLTQFLEVLKKKTQ
ncbi:MAG: SurA N-terminal domain-containing protein [Candidatus Omnitrophica bacterium]|nr:SurA N-terminal domain-containing protein [Candidatus Omnitrophota bacterium]